MHKEDDVKIHREKPHGNGGQDWSDISPSQGTPRFANDNRSLVKIVKQILL